MIKKSFLVYCLGTWLVLGGCARSHEDFSIPKGRLFPKVKAEVIDDLPNPIYRTYEMKFPIVGYEGYQFGVQIDLYALEGDNLRIIDKSRDPALYFVLLDGIIGTIKHFNKPEKTIKITEFLTADKDEKVFDSSLDAKARAFLMSDCNELILGVDPAYNGTYGEFSKAPSGKVFFFYGFVYSKRLNQIYFMRIYDDNCG